jgi:hypothetical protein
MKYGMLKVGDVVKYNRAAKIKLGDSIDNDEHIITKIDVSDGMNDVDEDTTGNEHVEWDNSTGADAYWLALVKTANDVYWEELIKNNDTAVINTNDDFIKYTIGNVFIGSDDIIIQRQLITTNLHTKHKYRIECYSNPLDVVCYKLGLVSEDGQITERGHEYLNKRNEWNYTREVYFEQFECLFANNELYKEYVNRKKH